MKLSVLGWSQEIFKTQQPVLRQLCMEVMGWGSEGGEGRLWEVPFHGAEETAVWWPWGTRA